MLIPGVRDAVRLLQSAPVKGMEAIGGILPQLQSATRGIEDKGLGVRLCWVLLAMCVSGVGGWVGDVNRARRDGERN